MKITCPILALVPLLALAPVLRAELMVDWGGAYVSSDQPFANANSGTFSEITQFGGFSGGDPMQLSPSSGYSGTSGLFYGMVALTGATGEFNDDTGVRNISGGDRIELKTGENNAAASELLLWRQADFLNGYDVGTLNLGAGTTIFIDVHTLANSNGGRAAIRLGSDYYITDVIFDDNTTFTLDLTEQTWYNYDPASSINTFGSEASIAASGYLANVTEVGFYFDVLGTSSNAVRVTDVQFNAVAVPEPGTWALNASLSILALVWLRRRGA